jgi:cytochrome c
VTLLAAISAGKAILIGIASGVVVVLAGAATLIALRRPRPRRGPELDIPPAMEPGPSDPDLEEPVRVKLYAWGAILVIFMSLWLPAVWIQESKTNANDLRELQAQSVERGRLTTMPGDEENQLGFNCERCHGAGLHGGHNVFNGGVVTVPDLTNVCGGAATGHPQIKSVTDIVNTIAQGRAGTDMPSWSVRYAGAMDDQQIADLVNYLIFINQDTVPKEQNICTNPAAAASPSAAASGSASPAGGEASPSEPQSPSPSP